MNRVRCIVAASLALFGCGYQSQAPTADFVITGGTVFLGDGSAGVFADVVISGQHIVAVGPNVREQYRANTTIDAAGLIVAPGFIDPHTHALSSLSTRVAPQPLENYLMQGVTTLVIGNDGAGHPDIQQQQRRVADLSIGPNVAMFVGHNAIRELVIGLADREPTESELRQMTSLVDSAMQQGALGLSAGLYYTPGVFASTDEVTALATVAAEYGGLYESHIRDESSYSIGLLAAIDEALHIGRESGARVHIAHIKALGVDVWGKSEGVIERINKARAAGQVVTADQYPWRASGTRLGNALLPDWSRDGGRESMLQRLQDSTIRARIQRDMEDNLRRRGGAQAILLTSGDFAGSTLAELSQQRRKSAITTALELIKNDETRIASFNMLEKDIQQFMVEPWVVTSSDGTVGHPRLYASFPRKFANYVRRQKVLPIADFIHRSSGMTADILQLCGRGFLRSGAFADVIVFDPDQFAPRANFEMPARLSVGVNEVIINGRWVVRDGRLTGVTSGQPLSRNACKPGESR